MVDLSNLSDQQLEDLYQSKKAQPSSSGPDLSKLSDEELDKLYQSKKTSSPEEVAKPYQRGLVGGEGQGFFSGFNPLAGPLRTLGNIPSTVMGPLKYPMEAISAATGYLGGHSLAAAEQAAGEYAVNPLLRRMGVPEERLQHPTHEQMYQQAAQDVNKALAAAGPVRGAAVSTLQTPIGGMGQAVQADIAGAELERAVRQAKAIAARKAAGAPPADIQQAQEALRQQGYEDLGIPRAITTRSEVLKSAAQPLSRFPWIGTSLREAVQAVPGRVGAGLEQIAAAHGTLPEEAVGGRIAETIAGAGETEKEAAQIRARALHEQAVAEWERANQEREGAIRAQETQATQAAERQFGNVHPTEMAEDTIRDD